MACNDNDLQVLDSVSISTANTARDGTGAVGVVCTGASATTGSYVDHVIVKATSSTTAGMIRFFIRDTLGAVVTLFKEIQVTQITPTSTTTTWEAKVPIGYTLRSNAWNLEASTHNAESFHITAYGEYGVRI